MRFSLTNKKNVAIALAILVLLNFFIYPELWAVQLFALLYLYIIYKKFADNSIECIYYSTILFAIVDFSLKLPLGKRYEVYYFYITIMIYMLVFIVTLIKNNKYYSFDIIKNNKYLIFSVIFIIYSLVSFFLASDKKLAFKSVVNYLIMISILVMIVKENINDKMFNKSLKFIEYIYIGVISLGTLEVLGLRFGMKDHYTDYGIFVRDFPFIKRIPVVFFYNPNNYAVVLVLGMSVLLIKYLYAKNKKEKYLYLLVYLISQINLIFTTSRTAWITIFIVLLFLFTFFIIIKNKKFYLISIKLTLATFLVFFAFSILPSMVSYYGKFNSTPILRMLNIKNINSKEQAKPMVIGGEGSTNERFTLIYDVIDGVIINHNFFGFGPGNTYNYLKYKNNTYGILNVHSLWFEILGDFGIFIFLYFIYIYLNIIIKLLKNYKNSNSYQNIIVATCLFGFIFLAFAPSSVIQFTPFWMLLGTGFSKVINY